MPGRLDRSPRTSLYADPKVSALLRERFVLHWESEAKAPSVVHYVLDADGRPVDAIPAAAAASEFRAELTEDADLERAVRGLSPADRAARLLHHQQLRRRVLNEEWPAFMVDARPARMEARA